jgi:hypothetical protein
MGPEKIDFGSDLSALPAAAKDTLDPVVLAKGWQIETEECEEDKAVRQYKKNDLHLRLQLSTKKEDALSAFVFLWQDDPTGATVQALDLAWYVDRKKYRHVLDVMDLKGKTLRTLLVQITTLVEQELPTFLEGQTARLVEKQAFYAACKADYDKRQTQPMPKWLNRMVMALSIGLAVMAVLGFIYLLGRS